MDTQSEQSKGATTARVVKRRSAILPILGIITFVLIVAAILIPGQIVSRLARDEVSAVGSLRALKNLELRYAAEHPSKGYTCECAKLKRRWPRMETTSTKDFYFQVHPRVTNSRLTDAKSTQRESSFGIKPLQCPSCQEKPVFVRSVSTKQVNFSLV
jgi:hypothetical protein